MSFSSKYSSSCGCSSKVKKFAAAQGKSCCNASVQCPPTPCCESNLVIFRPGVCFRPTCSLVATSDHFFIAFKNICDEEVPISLGNVFFFDQAAHYLNIHLFNTETNSYEVSLVDPTKEGAVIQEDACVIVTTGLSEGSSSFQKCLYGTFVAPAESPTPTPIVIQNGTGIPIGSTITFTFEGVTGSYTVESFISATGNLYSYGVINSGAGFPVGTIVDGGTSGACGVPIEVVTDVDICDLSASETLDTITGCENGSPRAGTAIGDGYVLAGTAENTWEQRKAVNFDCCVILDGVLKFSGNSCTQAEDTVIVRDVGLDCFTEAFNLAQAASSNLTGNVEDLPIIFTAWTPGTRTLTVKVATDDYLPPGEDFIEYPAGTALCLGPCCDQCLNGPQITSVFMPGEEVQPALISFASGNLPLPTVAGTMAEWLIGYNTADPGVVTALAITDTYNDDLEDPTGKPLVTDPMLFRQKICNTHPTGCPQIAEIEINYQIGFYALPANCRVHYEVKSFIFTAQTLADNVTANPNFSISSSAVDAGAVYGPSVSNTNVQGTEVGFGGITTSTKTAPWVAGGLRDYMQLVQCNCGLQIVWLHLLVDALETLAAGNMTIVVSARRRVAMAVGNYIPLVDNVYDQGWNV